MWLPNAPRRVRINEVSVRDGFQIEPEFIPTEQKIALIDRLSETGLARIEITSFVSPKAIPNLRDAQAVAKSIRRHPGVVYTALVPNARGCERALECDMDEINLVMSASETHNLANMRMTCEQSLEQFRSVMQLARSGDLAVSGCVATAFGCPFEGEIAPEQVKWAASRYLELGMDSITLADTTGMADPRQVSELVEAFLGWFPGVPLTLHFHNTRGMGLANVLAGLAAGVNSFDASLGGLGGCPCAGRDREHLHGRSCAHAGGVRHRHRCRLGPAAWRGARAASAGRTRHFRAGGQGRQEHRPPSRAGLGRREINAHQPAETQGETPS